MFPEGNAKVFCQCFVVHNIYLFSLRTLFVEQIEYGLKESALSASGRLLSPTMTSVPFGSETDDYLEIHYTDPAAHPGDSRSDSKHASNLIQQKDRGDGDVGIKADISNSELSLKLNAKDTNLCTSSAAAADALSSHNDVVRMSPSSVCEKSENEASEKPAFEDISLAATETESRSVCNESAVSSTATSRDSHPTASEVSHSNRDEHQQPTATAVAPAVTANDVNASVRNTASRDTIASESTASEFGISSNMEELLESEEQFSWMEEKLMLARSSEATRSTSNEFKAGTLSFDLPGLHAGSSF